MDSIYVNSDYNYIKGSELQRISDDEVFDIEEQIKKGRADQEEKETY